jgi:branched-chain amino acid transport system ATP-binding protein
MGLFAMLELRDVNKIFGGLHAIRNLQLSVKPEHITGLIGPNGAGKTTIFNVITGFLKPTTGTITFKGRNIVGLSAASICKNGICRTFQIVKTFSNSSVLDNVVSGCLVRESSLKRAKVKAEKILKEVGLDNRKDVLAGKLPIGQRKLLELARSLATEPELLLLDEVMGGLTPTEIKATMDKIRKIKDSGITILMIEHIMGAIMNLSDYIYVVNMGENIAEGSPKEVAHNPAVIKAYLGVKYGSSAQN